VKLTDVIRTISTLVIMVLGLFALWLAGGAVAITWW
jgi:hypothetical protein